MGFGEDLAATCTARLQKVSSDGDGVTVRKKKIELCRPYPNPRVFRKPPLAALSDPARAARRTEREA